MGVWQFSKAHFGFKTCSHTLNWLDNIYFLCCQNKWSVSPMLICLCDLFMNRKLVLLTVIDFFFIFIPLYSPHSAFDTLKRFFLFFFNLHIYIKKKEIDEIINFQSFLNMGCQEVLKKYNKYTILILKYNQMKSGSFCIYICLL